MALAPRRDLLTKMFNLLLDCDEQKADRFEALMIDERAERYLMDLTLGDASLITDENVEALYEEVRRATAQELGVEHEQKLARLSEIHAEDAKALRAQYEQRLQAIERESVARANQLSGQLLDEQSNSLAAVQKLKELDRQRIEAASAATRYERELHSERMQRLLPAFRQAKGLRRRFPLLMGCLTGTVLFFGAHWALALASTNASPLLSITLTAMITVVGFVAAYWEIPSQLFSGLRNESANRVFRNRAKHDGTEELLEFFVPDWAREELIARPLAPLASEDRTVGNT